MKHVVWMLHCACLHQVICPPWTKRLNSWLSTVACHPVALTKNLTFLGKHNKREGDTPSLSHWFRSSLKGFSAHSSVPNTCRTFAHTQVLTFGGAILPASLTKLLHQRKKYHAAVGETVHKRTS